MFILRVNNQTYVVYEYDLRVYRVRKQSAASYLRTIIGVQLQVLENTSRVGK